MIKSLKQLIEAIIARTSNFLTDEIELEIIEKICVSKTDKHIKLKQFTALINVNNNLNLSVVLSFDKAIIEKIFVTFVEEELDADPEMLEENIENMVAEFINIVIGNAIADLKNKKTAILFSPPMIIPKATRISYHQKVTFITCDFQTDHGAMSIFCITPQVK